MRPVVLLLAFAAVSVCLSPPLGGAADRPDVVVADFEADTYPAGWTTTGTAFGDGPAKGTLPGQMEVTGYQGTGLVNSFRGGDASVGTLTSAPFKLERRYVNFLIGGGHRSDNAGVNLLVGGKAVRSATGPNPQPNGTERLDWATWDVGEFAGQEAVIEVVDKASAGWGHVNVDQITLSDTRKAAEPARKVVTVDKPFLHLPVKNGAPARRMTLSVGGKTVREFDIELAVGVKADWVAFAEVGAFAGKELTVETVLPSGSTALDGAVLAADVPDAAGLYKEKHRPLFHFTSRRGWLNDPNGLVYHNGEWHLFYQHNPFGVEWGNMHWGHAVSKDLVRWEELGEALHPKSMNDMAFSGSAVVDTGNASGWGTRRNPPLVLAYTSTGRGECMAYSTDGGRSWTEYEKNPVVKHQGRDPKLVWYEKGKHWVMAVYDEADKKQSIAFYTSRDLKAWTFASRIDGFYECPDLFSLDTWSPTAKQYVTKWVLYGADGKYFIGEFDGKSFKPDHTEKKQLWYGNFYAAQTFDNDPVELIDDEERKRVPADGVTVTPRKIQIGWARGVTFPGMPFNQQMTVPVGLAVHLKGGPHLSALPELGVLDLHDAKAAFLHEDKVARAVGKPLVLAADLDAFDMKVEVELKQSTGFTFDLRGTKLVYDRAKGTLTCKDVTAPVGLRDGRLDLWVLVDRGSVEVFADRGRVAISVAAIPDEKDRRVVLTPAGEVAIERGTVYRIKSAWGK